LIEILLAVFNGRRHLGEQLDSLMGQANRDWTLLVRDDGSSDESLTIVSAYQKNFPGKIRIIVNEKGNDGALRNFAALLAASTAEYIMLCDQDDVWHRDKIDLTFGKMQELEKACGRECPLLVHTDMRVTDGDLRVVADSLWRYQKSDPVKGAALNRLLVQNCATGCSFMINRKLLELALPIPHDAVMHDWWLALVAGAFGKIGSVAEPTMLYRQHGRNDTGAKRWSVAELGKMLLDAGAVRRFLEDRSRVLRKTQDQGRALYLRFQESLSPGQRTMVKAFSDLDSYSFLRRKYAIVKFGFFHSGLARNIARLILW